MVGKEEALGSGYVSYVRVGRLFSLSFSKLILRERERERERNIDLLFHVLWLSLTGN